MLTRSSSRSLEFMALGGGSLGVAAVLLILQATTGTNPFSTYQPQFLFYFMVLSYLINYPHTLWSYRLAYRQGTGFITRNWITLLFVPSALLAITFFAIASWNESTANFPWFVQLDRYLEKAGIFLNFSMYSSLGRFLTANLIVFQMAYSARHYSLQALGIGLTYAHRDNYPLNGVQRRWLTANLSASWITNIVWGYTGFSLLRNMDFQYFSPRFPYFIRALGLGGFLVTLVGTLYFVVIKNYVKYRKWPSLSLVTPIVSLYLWFQPFWWPYGYQLWILPLAHCIQYLYFCYHAERGDQLSEAPRSPRSKLVFYYASLTVFIMGLSYAVFDYLPHHLDFLWAGYFATTNMAVVGINVLLNIHHYIIDGVVWKNPESSARRHLIVSLSKHYSGSDRRVPSPIHSQEFAAG